MKCDLIFLYGVCCSVNGSVCFVCCVFVNCLLKQLAICVCYFIVECNGVVKCVWRCSIG